jgi:serine/threonine protein kinase
MDVEPKKNNWSSNNNENSFNNIKVGLIDSPEEISTGMIQEQMNKITQIQRKRREAYLGKTVEDLFIKLKTTLLSKENVKDFLSEFSRSDIIGNGSYGEVRKVKIEDSFYVVKRIKFLKKHHQLENNIIIRDNPSLLNSPYLIKTFGYVRKGEYIYSIMEYLNGQIWITLEDYMNENNENMNTSHICSKLNDGLTEIHRLNFFHQDIKPANIMINRNSTPLQIKFIDYGFSIINPGDNVSNIQGHTAKFGCPVLIGNTDLEKLKNVDIFAVKIICILLKEKLYKNLFEKMVELIEEFWKQNFNPTVKVPIFPLYNILYLILLEITCDKKFPSENVYNLYSMFVGNEEPKQGKWNNLNVNDPSLFLKFKYIDRFPINSEICKIIINFLCSLLHREFIIDFATEFENSNILMSFYNQYINIS